MRNHEVPSGEMTCLRAQCESAGVRSHTQVPLCLKSMSPQLQPTGFQFSTWLSLNIAYLGPSWILENTDVPLVWSSCPWNTPPFICWKTTLVTGLGLVLCFRLLNVIVVQSPSIVRLFVTPWTASRQAFLSLIISWNLPKFMFIASVMSSRHLILWRPLLLRPSVLPSIKVFSNESSVHIS